MVANTVGFSDTCRHPSPLMVLPAGIAIKSVLTRVTSPKEAVSGDITKNSDKDPEIKRPAPMWSRHRCGWGFYRSS